MAGWRSSLGIGINVTGVDNVQGVMTRLTSWANVTIPQLTHKQADYGAAVAAQIAPRYSGALIQAISAAPGKDSKEWTIVSRTPKGQVGRTVPYHYFIQIGKGGSRGNVVKNPTGDHNYMQTTARLMSEQYPQLVLKSLRQTINKK